MERLAMGTTREDLKTLIDQAREDKLDLIRSSLEGILHPRSRDPRIEQFMQRSEEFQRQLPERLEKLQAGNDPGTVRGWEMAGGVGGYLGSLAYGSHEYTWQEGRVHVAHKLLIHAGHEMDVVDRLQVTEDDKYLIYEQEIYSGGRIVKRKEEFATSRSS
jgi:hypothetical protein